MRFSERWINGLFVLCALIVADGCGPSDPKPPVPKTDGGKGHGHSHAGEVAHSIDIEPPDYSAKWTHDDKTDTVTVVIYDADGKKEVAIPVASVMIETDINKKKEDFELLAQDPTEDEPPRASHFALKDALLITNLTIEKGVHAHLNFEVDGTQYEGHIEHDEHDDE